MAKRCSEEFRRDAVRIVLTSSLPRQQLDLEVDSTPTDQVS